jgi:hypothetical protein
VQPRAMRRDPRAVRPPLPICTVCGQTVTGDPDDQPDHPAGALCGACVRAREFDETLWELDLAHGDDGW